MEAGWVRETTGLEALEVGAPDRVEEEAPSPVVEVVEAERVEVRGAETVEVGVAEREEGECPPLQSSLGLCSDFYHGLDLGHFYPDFYFSVCLYCGIATFSSSPVILISTLNWTSFCVCLCSSQHPWRGIYHCNHISHSRVTLGFLGPSPSTSV